MTSLDEHERKQRCGLSLEQWFALPLELRKAWWNETDYGAKVAPAELVAKIRAAAKGHG